MAEIGKNLDKAIGLLKTGEVVAIPTETVYGLAGNAFSEMAVRKIFEAKNRPYTDPLIVHTHSVEKIEDLVLELPELARAMFETFSPGPLTILLRKSSKIPDLVTNSSPFVAVRIPDHPLTIKLLTQLDFPLAAPSANPFGATSPTLPAHVQATLGDRISYILDGGPCEVGLESTIIQIVNTNEIRVLRQGGLPEEDLRSLARLVEEEKKATPVVPGSLISHYAPKKEIHLVKNLSGFHPKNPKHTGFLGFNKGIDSIPNENQVLLSPKADLSEAARNLFSAMHKLDEMDEVQEIVTIEFPDYGLGKAINDRLKRATAKRS